MSYNGSGTFNINTAGQPVVTGTVISSTAFNALTADLATGLSTAITKDGQTTTTARIVFAQGISSTLTTDATSSTTGSIITAGGISCQKALNVGTTTTLGGALTYGGVTLNNAVTGTNNMVLSASPTLTGTLTAAAANFSGGVSVGSNSDTIPLSINGQDGANYTTYKNAGTIYGYIGNGAGLVSGGSKNNLVVDSNAALQFVINNNGVVAGMFGTDGSFLVGTTTNVGAGNVCIAGGSGPSLLIGKTATGLTTNGYTWNNSGGGEHVIASSGNGIQVNYNGSSGTPYWAQFTYNNGSAVGSITFNSVNTAFNTSSDARLKTNIEDASDAGAIIDALRVRKWDWIVNGNHEAYGFVAQEEHDVYAPAVTPGDDGETMTKPWMRDDSKLVPLLVKELQSVRARLAALEAN